MIPLNIRQIIARREAGLPYSKQEGEQIETFIAEHLVSVDHGEVDFIEQVQELFPDEYSRGIDRQPK